LARDVYENLKGAVLDRRSYYMLYIIDALLKSNKYYMVLAKKDLECIFKLVWQRMYGECTE
jgi:hypothetical protein